MQIHDQMGQITMRFAVLLLELLAITASFPVSAQQPNTPVDTDSDGLSDQLEHSLLAQFAPSFMIGKGECANLPAEFRSVTVSPEVQAENGTIYGQAFPAKSSTTAAPVAEIHYFHLWSKDCGAHGHPLDTEHVAVLVRASGSDTEQAKWHAIYWYAAAHENTVCDVSQISRASTLHATDRGAKVWISPSKHASYLDERLCQSGCGADRCEAMIALPPGKLINLGEPGAPMNGSLFAESKQWPLAAKMGTSNFPDEAVARLEQLPNTEIAWFNPGKHPAQGVISASGSTYNALSTSGQNTSDAISVAEDSTGNALEKSYSSTVHALGTSARKVGKALHVTPTEKKPEQNPE
jgi:hypothetical protein